VSTMTGAPPQRPPDVTWRDAVTPSSRASRRRWTLTYALLLMALLATELFDDTIAPDQHLPLFVVVPMVVVFGMLRRGTRRITALDHPDLDERDVAARNTAYRIAFPLLVLVVLGALAMLALALPETAHLVRVEKLGPVRDHGLFVRSEELVGLGLWIALWAIFLPTGVLAWREPDAIEPEAAGEDLSERVRDGLLGLALAGGFAVSVAEQTDFGVWPFAATLALLGGLARRAAGQPMMSRQRTWRVAIGVAMILVLVAIGFAVDA
jgi:hypothetical protein